MPITVTCPTCGKQTKAPDNAAGKKGKCPHCGGAVRVPKDESSLQLVEAEVVDADIVEAQVIPPPEPERIELADNPHSRRPPPPEEGDNRRPCPSCGEMIAESALRCRFCNETLDPYLKKQENKKKRTSRGDDEEMTTGDWVAAILCSAIGCIAGIVWMIQGKPKGTKMLVVSFSMVVVWNVVRIILQAVAVAMSQQP